MRHLLIESVRYGLPEDLAHAMADNPGAVLEDIDLDGQFGAWFQFQRWHTVHFRFRLAPGTTPRAFNVQITAAPERGGPEWVSAEDLRMVSLSRLLDRAVADMTGDLTPAETAIPRRHDTTRELLEQVAALFDEADGNRSAARDLIETRLSRSRSQAYRLLQKAEEHGYITHPEGTE